MQRYDKINQLHVFKYSVSRRRPRGILQGTLAAGSVCLLRSSSGFAVTVIMQQEQRIVSPTRASTWQSREYCTLLQQPKKKPGVPTGTHQRQIKTITGCTAGGTDSWSQTCLTGLGCRRRARGWMCQQGAGVVQHVNVVRKGFVIPTWNTSRE